jgi:arginine-tRNA-protein transferase
VRIDGPPRLAAAVECPYLPDRQFTQQVFLGDQVAPDEFDALLSGGWRHFGNFFFRPACQGCQACRPLRVDVNALTPTDSQRRVWNKNQDVRFKVVPLEYRDEYFELYREHSEVRFQKPSDEQEFKSSFCEPAVPSFLTEYRLGGELAALGFCDESEHGISSVYFVFSQKFASRSLGIYSVLKECELARQRGLRWYYLGYWVTGNSTMAYKGKFSPRQVLDWNSGEWGEA